jgi:hypothetical protein
MSSKKESLRLAHNHAIRLQKELSKLMELDEELYFKVTNVSENFAINNSDLKALIDNLKDAYDKEN